MSTTQFGLDLPINSVSLGQTSTAIVREIYKRGLTPPVFPIGGVDLSTQRSDQAFTQWLTNCINNGQGRHLRTDRTFRCWHINGSLTSSSVAGNDLLTFQECGQLSPQEVHILRQQRKVYVTNRYAQSFFRMCGIDAVYLPLGFDSFNFGTLEKRPKIDGVTSWGLFGKAEEKRKWTYRQLSLWAKRYGNRKEHRLNAYITNPFLAQMGVDINQLIGRALEGKQYWNITFHPFVASNAEYNVALQSSQIVLACTGSEGFDLPVFHTAALGAWPVALKAHAYLDYLTDQNAILVDPNGMVPIYDSLFFHQGQGFNQGNVFSFSDEAFYAGCEEAERRAKVGLNHQGMLLQKQTYAQTVDILLKEIST